MTDTEKLCIQLINGNYPWLGQLVGTDLGATVEFLIALIYTFLNCS